jgi:biotin operon repressor/anti-sigma regulatory factor (Ser/Thr protein kinase)
MSPKENILKYLSKHQIVSGQELSEYLGVSRQAVNKHLKELIQDGEVVKEGSTRGATYKLRGKSGKGKSTGKFEKTYNLKDLEEDSVFKEVNIFLNLEKELNSYALAVVRYSFTEILNNAIDHSLSARCSVRVGFDSYNFYFRIRDFGIGVFYSIFSKFDLTDESAAVGELIKGKTTTMAERHTGEGIFFTSKAADKLSLRSHKTDLFFDNFKKDVFIEEKRYLKGTDIFFSINKRSKRKLEKVFQDYASEEFDYRFDRTRVQVKLFQKQYISRSEAKRLVHGLDKFAEIILDFNGVKTIGQGFADEVFRVFKQEHPDIIIKTENVSPALEPMIRHVVDN